jgi:hypothetical protein
MPRPKAATCGEEVFFWLPYFLTSLARYYESKMYQSEVAFCFMLPAEIKDASAAGVHMYLCMYVHRLQSMSTSDLSIMYNMYINCSVSTNETSPFA